MWGRRRKRGGHKPRQQLSRQLSLGLLEDAMARAEQQQEEGEEGEEAGPEPVPYPQAGHPAPAVPPARPGLQDEDVPVDNSADPGPTTAGQDESPQSHQELPAQRSKDSTRHRSFGGKNPS